MPKEDTGFTLIEVLIGLLVLGISLGGILSVFYMAENLSKISALNGSACLKAQELVEEIKKTNYEDEQYINGQINSNYHTGAYNNYLGPEYDNIDTVEYDDDINDNGSVDITEYDDVDDFNGYQDVPVLSEGLTANDRTAVVTGVDGNGNEIGQTGIVNETAYTGIKYKKIVVSVRFTWKGKVYEEKIITCIGPRTGGL